MNTKYDTLDYVLISVGSFGGVIIACVLGKLLKKCYRKRLRNSYLFNNNNKRKISDEVSFSSNKRSKNNNTNNSDNSINKLMFLKEPEENISVPNTTPEEIIIVPNTTPENSYTKKHNNLLIEAKTSGKIKENYINELIEEYRKLNNYIISEYDIKNENNFFRNTDDILQFKNKIKKLRNI